jgi:hypothetical protein
VESHNDPTEMNTSTMMAYHSGAWTCQTPVHMEDWTHRGMYHAGFRIRIHLIRIRIQHFRLNTDPDPDPIRIKVFCYQKL